MKKILSLLCLGLSLQTFAQTELFIPRDIQRAYQAQTRSLDGKAGQNYWQNSSKYSIKADFDPETGLLKGTETIVYENNSPKEINSVYIRLYMNLYKKGVMRMRAVEAEDIGEGMKIEKISVENNEIGVEGYKNASTITSISLAKPIGKGEKVTLQIQWSFVMPKKTDLREGFYENGRYFVAYWYPQVAVYDDISSWDATEYTGEQEFYNDFNDYDVEITVPKNYVIWATGVWQNPQELLTPDFLKKYEKAQKNDEIVRFVSEEDLKKGNFLQNKTTVWKFKAQSVPDFSFATSADYLWDLSSVQVGQKRVLVQAAYNPQSEDFKQVADYTRQTIAFLSEQMPATPFPYPQMSVYNGGGGMEFPMMVNDGSFDVLEAVYVTSHEVAHTYFPFMMGINEKKYAWMDEGFTQFMPQKWQNKMMKIYSAEAQAAQIFANHAGRSHELPLMIPSNYHYNMTYQISAYIRPQVALNMLLDYLGEEKFRKAMQEYIKRWSGKHPIPYDFFFTFNEATGENLNWFWQKWFFESSYSDLSVKEAKQNGKKLDITVQQNGNLPVPIYLEVDFEDGGKQKGVFKMNVWENKKTFSGSLDLSSDKKVTKITLGLPTVPDSDPNNNVFEIK